MPYLPYYYMDKIAFLTTQSAAGSTVVGRVLPLADKLAKEREIHVLVHQGKDTSSKNVAFHMVGQDPFIRKADGKQRLRGFRLIARMKWNAVRAAWALRKIRPDYLVIVKALPENVLAAWLARIFFLIPSSCVVILDVDDFELTANKLSGLLDRIAIHWANRAGAMIATHITVATPFLKDYFSHLSGNNQVMLLPTGVNALTIERKTQSPPALLYAGSVSQASGHRVDILPSLLQQVRKEVPNATLIMAGDGDDVPTLKAAFEKLGLQNAVTWVGRYSAADVSSILTKASVLIDPVDSSITNRAKSSSRVALGVTHGYPVVTSNIGIRSWLVPSSLHEMFFAVPADPDDYAKKVIGLLKRPLTVDEINTMKSYAERYSWDTLADSFVTILV